MMMVTPLSLAEAHAVPRSLDAMIPWFESLSCGLVLLEPYALDDLRHAVNSFRELLLRHLARSDAPTSAAVSSDPVRRLVEADHRRFSATLEQLGWLLGIVESEDHGGHRQALGQYGRLVCEAARRHLADERALAYGPRPRNVNP